MISVGGLTSTSSCFILWTGVRVEKGGSIQKLDRSNRLIPRKEKFSEFLFLKIVGKSIDAENGLPSCLPSYPLITLIIGLVCWWSN